MLATAMNRVYALMEDIEWSARAGRAGLAPACLRVRVRIDSIDTRANTVTFTGPQGNVRTVAVRDAGMRRFIRTLREMSWRRNWHPFAGA